MVEPWVVFEDEHLLAVTKPAGITSERADRTAQIGLAEWVAARRPGRSFTLLDRLDRETSGVLVLADGRRRVVSSREAEYGGPPADRRFAHRTEVEVHELGGGSRTVTSRPPPSFDLVLGGAAVDGPDVAVQAALERRTALFDPTDTDAYVWMDRHHDGVDGLRVERLGSVAVVVDHRERDEPLGREWVDAWCAVPGVTSLYHQRRPRGGRADVPQLVVGPANPSFAVVEHGVRFLIDLEASATSTGLFLDQRDTRFRLRHTDLAGRTVLNAFGHTGSLSVAAALAGAETLTLDLSTRYLDRARDNLRANDLDPADHDFIYGDALHWMERLARKGRAFDVVLVDPPSTSTGRSGGRGSTRWVVERDLHDLVARAARLTAPGGSIFVSTNLRRLSWARFEEHVRRGLGAADRAGEPELGTVPLDFRTGSGDPSHLKTAWVDLDR